MVRSLKLLRSIIHGVFLTFGAVTLLSVLAVPAVLAKDWANETAEHRQLVSLRNAGRNQEALVLLNELLRANPADYHAYYLRGIILAEFKHFNRARSDFDKCLALKAFLPDCYAWKSKLDYSQGDHESAIKNATLAIKHDPKNHSAWSNRGLAYLALQRNDLALADLRKALSLSPQDTTLRLNLAHTLYVCDQDKEALSQLDLLLKQKPELAAAYQERSCVNRALKRYEQALLDSNRAIALSQGKVPFFIMGRAFVFLEMGNFTEAIADSKRALAVDRRCGEAYVVMGTCSYKVKRYEEAIRFCNQALECSSKLSEAYRVRGLCYESLGQSEKSMADLERANAIRQDSESYITHAQLAARQGYYEQALDDLSAAGGKRATFKPAAGQRSQDFAPVLALYEKMIKANPSNYDLNYDRGLTCFMAQKTSQSCADFERYIEATAGKGRNVLPAAVWTILAYRKMNQPARASAFMTALDSKKVACMKSREIEFLRGKRSGQDLVAACKSKRDLTFAGTLVGLNLVYSGKTDEGRCYLKRVQTEGDSALDEYAMAITELSVLESSRRKAH